jgi:hypothetical protein
MCIVSRHISFTYLTKTEALCWKLCHLKDKNLNPLFNRKRMGRDKRVKGTKEKNKGTKDEDTKEITSH